MNHPEYTRAAHRATALRHLIHHLQQQYIGEDGPPKAILVCEKVFYEDRIVTEDSLQEIEEYLNHLLHREESIMEEYEALPRVIDLPPVPNNKKKTDEAEETPQRVVKSKAKPKPPTGSN
jgi:hypothetical protein